MSAVNQTFLAQIITLALTSSEIFQLSLLLKCKQVYCHISENPKYKQNIWHQILDCFTMKDIRYAVIQPQEKYISHKLVKA